MSLVNHVIISCAGIGSRLGLNIPKCLVEIKGKTLIERQLALLTHIPDVRIVVGFKELEVIQEVIKIRKDVTFVRNPDYATTSNSHSLYLATKDLKDPFITIDGDMIINPKSFSDFLTCIEQTNQNLIGITDTKTEEAVFVILNENRQIEGFQTKPPLTYEWCGIAYLDTIRITPEQGFQYRQFYPHLPLQSFEIECFEIDTPSDLNMAIQYVDAL